MKTATPETTRIADWAFDAQGRLHPTVIESVRLHGLTGGAEADGWIAETILAFTLENEGRMMQYPEFDKGAGEKYHAEHWRGTLVAGVDISATGRLRVRLRKEGTTVEDDFHLYIGEPDLLVFLDGRAPSSAAEWLAARKA